MPRVVVELAPDFGRPALSPVVEVAPVVEVPDSLVGLPFPREGESATAVLAALRPGLTLGRVVEALADPAVFEVWLAAGVGPDGRGVEWRRADLSVSVAQAWESLSAWTAARREVAAAGELLELLRPADVSARWSSSEVVSGELAAALRVSPRSMGGVLDRAQRLTAGHAGTLWLLEQGFITAAHARAVVDECQVVADRADVVAGVEAAVLSRAPEQTAAQLRRAARRAVARLDPDGDAVRHEQAAARRELRAVPLPDGMAMLTASLTAPEAQTGMAALDAVAAELPDDPDRTRGSGRVDALVLLCSAVLGDPDAVASVVRSVPAEPAVGVTVGLDVLLGLSEAPGDLAGYGPVPAAMARALAADGVWARWVTDPVSGELVDASPYRYRVGASLRRHVTARDVTCRHPGCATRAARCDIDHVRAFDHEDPARGGSTVRANLCARCRRHHNLKTWFGWSAEVAADGTVASRSPLGRVYSVPPTPQPTQDPLLR